MTQIQRIAYYEEVMDRVAAAAVGLEEALEAFFEAFPLFRELDAYYGGDLWRQDYEDDEAGRLPADLKRGVLSQDAAYNVLSGYRQLLARVQQEETER